jgi:hypothetical protein
MEKRLDAGLLLNEHGQRQSAEPRAGAKTIRDTDDVHAIPLQLARALHRPVGLEPARRQQLDANDEAASR